jgi:hypothetical protein
MISAPACAGAWQTFPAVSRKIKPKYSRIPANNQRRRRLKDENGGEKTIKVQWGT